MDRLPEIETMYANMSDKGRDFLFGMARQLLHSFPGEGAQLFAPVQKINQVEPLDGDANCSVYQFPLLGIRKSVYRKKADLA